MKLIDILVQELPKHGGWPVGVKTIEMHMDGDIFFDGDHSPDSFCLPQCDDGWRSGLGEYSNEVTREQYESALSASQPQWNGEGLPPVGCEFEHSFHANDFSTWHWRKCTATGKHGVLCVDENDTELYLNDISNRFRPIRSEADQKRKEATGIIADICRSSASNGHSAELIYDAIAAGKIPHIQLK